MTYAFQTEGLVKRFGETTALAGIDLAARPGSVLGVLGPNGAGKTTAVRILATLLQPDEGRAMACGYDVVRDAAKVRELIGLTGQYASVDEDLTGHENLVLIGQLLNMRRKEAQARAAQMLERFELTDAGGQKVGTYSGGMRRRLDLAASLIGRPAVIYLDEPTTGLDPGKRGDVWRMIRSMTDGGGAVLLTTQYLEEADALADDIVVIDHGEVIARGTAAELKALVGGQTISVRPKDPGRLEEVATIISGVAGRPAEAHGRDAVTVQVDGDAELHRTVRELEAAGIGVTELALRLPSLDEVFFTLTGRSKAKRDGEDEDEEEAA
ncbi:oleandomycin transport system ATP-binding protein [Actinomadura meyerae]|jgi:oleandomycin transport system ATP-binding protein|uniref:Oleandomycin transport system ATP-binding protein n=1 Tax=Actinomadura meyerae TaxID=240840 RepID=A0A239NB33_9ACTN|nr:ATP-binding cassette domain-containing protein [Actinomadura meyerae]SNT52116.1 oleandomycin transport system ATP-binding protein [Actinomadura meyerae]